MREDAKATHAKKGHQGRGQAHGQGHGDHDHDRRKQPLPQHQQQRQRPKPGKTRKTPETPQKHPESEPPQPEQQQNGHASEADRQPQAEVPAEQEPEAQVKQEAEAGVGEHGGRVETNGEESPGGQGEAKGRDSPEGKAGGVSPAPPSPSPPRRLAQENYDVRSFSTSLDEFVHVLSDPRYQEMQGEYPVEDLMSVVTMVTAAMEDYKQHTQNTGLQLQALRDSMRTVKENLHLSITRQAFHLAADEEQKTAEELELEAKLAQLNATVAQAHAEVAEANKLSAETSQKAIQASIAAQQAHHEAVRIQEEIQLKAERERKRREEEERRRQEEERRQAEEERRREEERKAQEKARKKLEEDHSSLRKQEEMAVVEQWTPHVFQEGEAAEGGGGDLHCVMRANPAHFKPSDVRCDVVPQGEGLVTYGDQEELISKILDLKSADDNKQAPEHPIYVAIPYTARLPASREPVVKAMVEGRWTDLNTQEATLEGHKEYKFAQAKVDLFTQLLVMSRFKRDYMSVQNPRRVTKLTSSYDHRVVLTVPKNTFPQKVQLVMQVQPVDSTSVSEFRSHDPRGKQLLTSSPILHLEWYTSKQQEKFDNFINVTLPCPPNPAKARKLALLRKQKEEKLKSPKPAIDIDHLLKPKKTPASPQQQPQTPSQPQSAVARAVGAAEAGEDPSEEETQTQRQTKWYMGQYGQTEDDENDQLCLLTYRAGRWSYEPHVRIVQAKLDLVAFDFDTCCERLMVVRTRPDVEEDSLKHMAQGLTEQLSRRSAKVILRRRTDDPYDICCHVVPTSAVERAERSMRAEGYTEETDQQHHNGGKEHVTSLREGDSLLLEIQGNLRFQDNGCSHIRLPFNSNLPTHASFHLAEVNKYLQKNFEVFRGKVRIVRKYEVVPSFKMRRHADDECLLPVYKTEVIFQEDIDIPKYHVEPDPSPRRVEVVMRKEEGGVLGEGELRHLAGELGEEWTRLASRLNVRHERQEALRRATVDDGQADSEGSVAVGAGREEEVKYMMLVTWLKRCPQAADKVSILCGALETVGRRDLAKGLRHREREAARAHRHSTATTSQS
ncbi:LOW QUALITY PROTEIN: death domain-containing protein 1-like [Babylonia areolata]|uniref:LOW QUALITY PROTEIN: death domain-containing protein 1-like n=1 Tax=Babylonia areolata TaxID=304850 RepID=UPI003FD2E824